LKGWLEGDTDWEFSVNGYSYSWVNKRDESQALRVREEAENKRSSEGYRRLNRTTVRVSKGFANALNRKSQPIAGEMGQVVEELLKNQKEIYQMLFSLGSKNH